MTVGVGLGDNIITFFWQERKHHILETFKNIFKTIDSSTLFRRVWERKAMVMQHSRTTWDRRF